MNRTLIIAARSSDGSSLAHQLIANGLSGSDIDLAPDAHKAITQFSKKQYGVVVFTYDTNAGGQLKTLKLQISGLRIMFSSAQLIVRGPYDFSQELKADGFVSTRGDPTAAAYLAQILANAKDDEPLPPAA